MYYYIHISERIYSDLCRVKRIFYRNPKPLNGHAPFFLTILDPLDKNERIYSDFYALFKPILAIIVGGLNRSDWVGMLRFQQFIYLYLDTEVSHPPKETITQIADIKGWETLVRYYINKFLGTDNYTLIFILYKSYFLKPISLKALMIFLFCLSASSTTSLLSFSFLANRIYLSHNFSISSRSFHISALLP